MSITTHVLDTARGIPALGVNVLLTDPTGDTVAAITDVDGRARLAEAPLLVGNYQLVFAVAEYFALGSTNSFYPEVTVAFSVTDGAANHHVPLLVSPYAYSTYRGS
ncbi:MAG: hydroxyisourate hydrolase [Geodermatophilaceae bacterium]|nr:hydroxyisourate hydrolase [Geodermatophilaceae bacterium]